MYSEWTISQWLKHPAEENAAIVSSIENSQSTVNPETRALLTQRAPYQHIPDLANAHRFFQLLQTPDLATHSLVLCRTVP